MTIITILVTGCSSATVSEEGSYCGPPYINRLVSEKDYVYSTFVVLCGADVIQSGIQIKTTKGEIVAQEELLKGWANGIFVKDKYIYVANGTNGFLIINASNIEIPVVEGKIDTPGYANAVYVIDDIALIADGTEGIQVIDISKKSSPEIIFNYETVGYAFDVIADEENVYIADGSKGLLIIGKEELIK